MYKVEVRGRFGRGSEVVSERFGRGLGMFRTGLKEVQEVLPVQRSFRRD